MKTSVLVSGIAALSLFITIAETSRQHNEGTHYTSTNNLSIETVKMVSMLPGVEIIGERKGEVENTTLVTTTKDLSYLKFNVADYTDASEMVEEINDVNSYDYLKFDVENYQSSDKTESYELIELPVNEFGYLKFDVENYQSTDQTESYESIELPVNEFDYLKFDLTNFMSADEENSVEITELPVDEFSYLKFDVTKYSDSDNLNNGEKIELPESAN